MASDTRRQPSTTPPSAAPPSVPTVRDVLIQAERLRAAAQPAQALALCRAVLRQFPGDADALNLAGVAAHQSGDDAAAIAYLQDAATRAPERADILRNLGILLLARGRPQEAVGALEQAAKAAPADARVRVDLGNALAAAQRETDAIGALRQALATDPRHLPAWIGLGRLLRRTGQAAAAAEAFGQAVALAPADMTLRFDQAESLGAAGQAEAAATAYRQVLARQPDDADAHNNLGTVLAGLGQLDAAATALRAALTLRPEDGRILLNLGNVLRYAADRVEARDVLRRAAQLAPGNAAAQAAFGTVLADLGDGGAEETLRRAIALDGNSLEAHYALAGLLQRAGRGAEARLAYAEVLRIDPGNATARHLAAALAGDNPGQPPAGFIRDLFDGYADHFEDHLVANLGYAMPAILHRLVVALLPGRAADSPPPLGRVRDLGCGTGLAGAAFRQLAAGIEGVDLSPRMLAAARAKGIYDALHLGDVVGHLREQSAAAPDDLLIAADMMNYLGDLAPLFAAAADRLRPGGLFAFSVERLEGDGFRLCPTGRYVHGETYLRRLAAAHGFAVAAFEEAVIRNEAGVPEQGMAWVLRRAGAGPA